MHHMLYKSRARFFPTKPCHLLIQFETLDYRQELKARKHQVQYIFFFTTGSMPGDILLDLQKGRSETFPCFSFKTRVKNAKSVHLMALEI